VEAYEDIHYPIPAPDPQTMEEYYRESRGLEENFLKYKGFSGVCEYDSVGEIYTGEVTGIRSVITFQGRTAEEIEASFRESVDIYLKMCEKDRE
jgi:hypothetical protein